MLKLKNPKKEVFLFTLYHSVYCDDQNTCKCDRQRILRNVNGGSQYFEIINPASIHLEGGMTVDVHENALKIQQVASALDEQKLIKVQVEVKPVGDTPKKVADKKQVVVTES